ncbi:hypothetical protein AYI70_g3847 [Smittium culicis]|uniref:Uncharacterized protein n=1 Tax=Smittium culicis TaxID=133412 RepID=A0A1R1XZC9_9FUNG|nr:hypothetical protein AYI70_g4363 [Smittium culicis]OMJ20844.1 hypothetical protein AYI70_g3847 [Smittium culicis]
MDQNYMKIIQDLTEKVNDLSAIVRQGFPQRQTLDAQAPECDDIHRRTVVPAVEIESFPELLEPIPDLKKDFFSIPLAEKARKDIIYGCPKFTGMNYQPPPLNDAAPTSFKRTDAIYGYYVQDSTEESLSSAPAARVRLPRCNGANLASCSSPTPTENLQQSRRSVPGKEEPKISSKGQEFGRSVEKTTSSPVGGRLAMFRAAWAKLTDDQWVMNIVEKGLIEILHTRGHARGLTADAPSPSLQEEDDPGGERGHHKGSISSLVKESYRGDEGENPRVLQQPICHSKEKWGLRPALSIVKGQGPTPRSQQVVEHRKDHCEGIGEFYRESTGNISGPVAWKINATKTLRTEKHRTLVAEILNSCNYAHGTSDSEFEILEGVTDNMEWPVIHTRDTRTGNLYRFQRQSMECSCGFKVLLRNMEYTGGIDAYQCQRAPKDFICTASERSYRQINPNIFGQYNNTGIREEIWQYYFDQIIRNRRANIDTLPQNQHSPPSNVRTFSIEPCRRTEQVNSTNGMVSVGPNIRHTELTIRSSRRGPIRFQIEQEAENLLQLVPRHQCYGSEFTGVQLEELEEPICVTPWNFISQVIQKVRRNKLTITLITPLRKYAIWFPDLVNPSISQPLLLQATVVVPEPKSGKSPLSENKHWNLMAWRIGGVPSKRNVCQILPLTFFFPTNDVENVSTGTIMYNSGF